MCNCRGESFNESYSKQAIEHTTSRRIQIGSYIRWYSPSQSAFACWEWQCLLYTKLDRSSYLAGSSQMYDAEISQWLDDDMYLDTMCMETVLDPATVVSIWVAVSWSEFLGFLPSIHSTSLDSFDVVVNVFLLFSYPSVLFSSSRAIKPRTSRKAKLPTKTVWLCLGSENPKSQGVINDKWP